MRLKEGLEGVLLSYVYTILHLLLVTPVPLLSLRSKTAFLIATSRSPSAWAFHRIFKTKCICDCLLMVRSDECENDCAREMHIQSLVGGGGRRLGAYAR